MHNLTDFMCICTEKPRAEAEACYTRVLEKMGGKPAELLTEIAAGMLFGVDNFAGTITGIYGDQWFGVSAEVRRYDKETKKYVDHAAIFVQCDRVEHGVTRVYELFEEATKLDPVEKNKGGA